MTAFAEALAPLWREIRLAYYGWALSEIDPLHPDLPFIVHRLNDLRSIR